MTDVEESVGVDEAAEELGVSRWTVIRLYDSDKLKGYRTSQPRGHRRIYVSSLKAYLRERDGESGSDV